ncbi:MAG: hydrogenase formation protein HypD [Desulfobacterota bacterium]|nr:hydrogenase formation protein HypD [Thermodesulfobacteriota bacterium]MDW8001522.1 hydrogenase formation protein HypD [Deltaproteobacteria bacterium]
MVDEWVKDLIDEVLSLSRSLKEKLGRRIKIMEVCGTHTMVISKSGIRSLFSETVELISGPGCPVCVTDQMDIDKIILYAQMDNITLCTFGDMIKVPGSLSSLEKERAKGARIEVFYSPSDALNYAKDHPDEEIVFVGIGFETTIPLLAHCILEAKRQRLQNFSLFSLHKCLPPAMKALLDDPEISLDGLILPGHVCTITGSRAFEFIADDYRIPCCVSGFEPTDVIEAIGIILAHIKREEAKVEIGYKRLVKPEGNLTAKRAIYTVFEPSDARWRGFGEIPGSGLKIKEEYRDFDAEAKFPLPEVESVPERKGCICGDIVKGKKIPTDCSLFSKVCNPKEPFGPCMVSQEGACAAYYNYGG